MKLLILLLAVAFTGCAAAPEDNATPNVSISTTEVKAPSNSDFLFTPEGYNSSYNMHPIEISGMRYHIFYYTGGNQANGFKVINVTKDSLEVEKLKKSY